MARTTAALDAAVVKYGTFAISAEARIEPSPYGFASLRWC
jgi:hypothetical protein